LRRKVETIWRGVEAHCAVKSLYSFRRMIFAFIEKVEGSRSVPLRTFGV
jgi:hypothetical protein